MKKLIFGSGLLTLTLVSGCGRNQRLEHSHDGAGNAEYAYGRMSSANVCKLRVQSITIGDGTRLRIGRDCWWWYDRNYQGPYGNLALGTGYAGAAMADWRARDNWIGGVRADNNRLRYAATEAQLKLAASERRVEEAKGRIKRLELELASSRESKADVERELKTARAEFAQAKDDLDYAIAAADEAEVRAEEAEAEQGGAE